jgi:hypothetical protein
LVHVTRKALLLVKNVVQETLRSGDLFEGVVVNTSFSISEVEIRDLVKGLTLLSNLDFVDWRVNFHGLE